MFVPPPLFDQNSRENHHHPNFPDVSEPAWCK